MQNCKEKKRPLGSVSFHIGKRGDWTNVNFELRQLNWHSLLSSRNINDNFNIFKSKLDIVLRKYVPIVNIKTKGQPPWFDDEIREMKKMKDNLRIKAKSVNATSDDIAQFEL